MQGALREGQIGLLTFCNIDVSTDYAVRGTVTIVRYEAACFDPSNLTVGTDNAIIAIVVGVPVNGISLKASVQPWQIVRVNSGSPIGTVCLRGPLGQTVDSRITRRNMHSP